MKCYLCEPEWTHRRYLCFARRERAPRASETGKSSRQEAERGWFGNRADARQLAGETHVIEIDLAVASR